ncbi:hypothetical protein C5167_029615 [Papaver somniferum]|nr:hypothetical protein C5167_029615 [Papaver somniferum]
MNEAFQDTPSIKTVHTKMLLYQAMLRRWFCRSWTSLSFGLVCY